MRTSTTMYISSLTLIVASVMIGHSYADHHTVALDNSPDQVTARTLPGPASTLGGAANKAATVEWRKRRVYARARELSKRGIHVRKDVLDNLTVAEPVGLVEPDVHFFAQELKGRPTTSMLSVGMLMGGKSMATAYSKCTVTLTRPDTILTARHCLSHTHGDTFWVYFPYGGVRSVSEDGISFFCKDGDSDCSIYADDLAIATLDTPYTFLSPSVSGHASTVANGQKAKIVGYGLNNPDLADYGIKREGVIELASCTMVPIDGLSLCFEHPLDEISGASIYAACNNDSGGPMLTPSVNSAQMVGVASQMMGTCDGAGEGRYVNVTDARYEEWLKNAYCDPTCPGEPNLALMELIREPSGYLDESDAAEAYTFTVPESTSSLVVTLNHGRGWFPSPNDFDLELPAALSPTCVKFIEAEVCEVSTPPPGVYSTIVRKVNGEAYYQLSAVAFLAAENSDNQQ